MKTKIKEKKKNEESNEGLENRKGWECPRCRKINSPLVEQCKCESSIFAPTEIDEILEAFRRGDLETLPYFSDEVELPQE